MKNIPMKLLNKTKRGNAVIDMSVKILPKKGRPLNVGSYNKLAKKN
jgi:hypothetical protein